MRHWITCLTEEKNKNVQTEKNVMFLLKKTYEQNNNKRKLN